jgi:CBS domain-containing protein
MRVEHLMKRPVKTCGPDDPLSLAAQLMWDSDCGFLPVCEGNPATRLVGVITDRDICMSALFRDLGLSEMRVADAMSKGVLTCAPADSVTDAERIMRRARIRRLPVADAGGALIGIITLADLALEADREQTSPKQAVTSDEVGVTLASICTPGSGSSSP